MAIRTITHTHPVRSEQAVDNAYDENAIVAHQHNANVAARVVWFVTDLILLLLGFRFVLALFGANPANAFANFIYSLSHPFVSPFFNLFNYNYQIGYARVEVYTLVAIAVYAVIGWVIARLVTINKW